MASASFEEMDRFDAIQIIILILTRILESFIIYVEIEVNVQSAKEASQVNVDSGLASIEQERHPGGRCQEEVRPSRENNTKLLITLICRARRVVKVQRAIVGATLEELSKKRQIAKPVSVATEAALK